MSLLPKRRNRSLLSSLNLNSEIGHEKDSGIESEVDVHKGKSDAHLHRRKLDNRISSVGGGPGIFMGRFSHSNNCPTVLNRITWNIHQGKLQHEILGELRVTLKIFRPFERDEAAKHFMVPDHPNIMKRITTDTFSYLGEKHIYVAMEECHHQNLDDYVQSQIKDGVAFDADKYLSYSYQIALGVEFLHRHKIYIGYLRRDAIFLSMDKTTIKLCEFHFLQWMDEFGFDKIDNNSKMAADIHDLGLIYGFHWSYEVYDFLGVRAIESHRILLPNSNSARSLIDCMTDDNQSSRPSAAEVVRHEIFKHLAGGRPSEDKNTSTEDLLASITAEGVRTLIDAESDVVTRFGNLGGGLVISKSIRKVIMSDNEQLDVGDCLVAFSPDSFTKSTPVTVTAEINSSKWPKNFIGYTPTLYVDAEGLKRKVRVKLPSWCVNNQPGKAKARILHIPKGRTEWEDTNVTLPVTNEPYFEFEWQDFSPILIGSWFRSNTTVDFRIAGSIYISNANEVSIAYHINDKATPTSESLVSEAVENAMAAANPPRSLKVPLNNFTAKVGESIETHINSEDPPELQFKPAAPFSFTVDKYLGEKTIVNHHGAVFGNLEEAMLIYMQCMIYKKSEENPDKTEDQAIFTCDWTPRKRRAIEQKEYKGVPMQNVNINLQGPKTDNSQHHVMAKNYANQEAKMKFSESGSTTTVTSSGVSTSRRKDD